MHSILLATLLVAPSAEAETTPTVLPETGMRALPTVLQDEEEEPMNVWNGTVSLFAGYTDGNSDTDGFGGAVDTQYLREKDRTTLKFFYDKKFSEDTRLVDRRFADAKYDYFLNEKTYWWGKVRFDVDREANLELQSLASTGIGHQFHDTDTWKLNGEAGISYIDQDFDDPVAGAPDNDDDFVAARLGYNADYIPSEKWNIGQSTDYYPSLDDSDVWYLVANTRAQMAFTESMSGSLTYLFTHQETPAAGNKSDDHNILLGLDWNF